ncbi:MAG TPA: EthD family reductase [Ramlibacter sp.]|nr:EthD family reductase [Ramlibacter sp.]
MVKIIIFFKRKPGMSVEDFQKYWRTNHAGLVVKLPGIRRYKQSHVLASAYRKGEPVYDGVAESWFDSTEAMKELSKTPEYATVLADEPNFIDRASMKSIITDEYVVKDAPVPEAALKSIDFVNRKAGMPVDDFQKYWRETHGPLCQPATAMRRYVQNHTRRAIYDSGRTPAYDGVAMAWFDSMDALRAAAGTPQFAALRNDVANFIDRDRSPSLLTTELVVLP